MGRRRRPSTWATPSRCREEIPEFREEFGAPRRIGDVDERDATLRTDIRVALRDAKAPAACRSRPACFSATFG